MIKQFFSKYLAPKLQSVWDLLKQFAKNYPRASICIAFVFLLHAFFMIFASLFNPPPPPFVSKRLNINHVYLPKPLTPKHVDTISKKTPSPTPVKKPPPSKPKKKTAAKPKQTQKRKTPQTTERKKLLSALQENIAKIETKQVQNLPKSQIQVPRPIAELKADTYALSAEIDESSDKAQYQEKLIGFLKETLTLPAFGVVKIKLTLTNQGRLKDLEVISSDSEINRLYLERSLADLDFPPFLGELVSSKKHTFFLTFCSNR